MISTIKKAGYGVAATLLLPAVALAQGGPGAAPGAARGLEQTLQTVSNLLAMVVPILIGLAVIFFLWSLLQYITKAGQEKSAALQQMIWGIIAIAVMVSVWGLVGILRDTLGIQSGQPPEVPAIPTLNRS